MSGRLNKRKLRKISLLIFLTVILSVLVEWVSITDWNILVYHNKYPVSTILPDELALDGYSFDANGNLVSSSDDPCFIVQGVNQYIHSVTVVFGKRIEKNYKIQIFYQEKGETDFTEARSVSEYATKGEIKHTLSIDKNVSGFRIDIGEKAGDSFALSSVIFNSSSYRDFLFPFTQKSFGRIIFYSVVIFLLLSVFRFGIKAVLHDGCRYRILIGCLIVLLFTAGKINGSSISQIFAYLPGYDGTAAFGEPRGEHSDEWAVFTAMAISQERNDYGYYSSLYRGTDTDMAVIYGQPVRDPVTLFRPFLLVYLFAGTEYGLAFYWTARIIVLFLVSFEMGLLVFEKDKKLSLILALLLSCAPVIQWWNSVNGICELFIFSQLAILAFDRYLKADSRDWRRKIPLALLIAWCAGCFIMVLYPAWQITMGYLLLVFLIWVMVKNRKNFHFSRTDALGIGIFLAVMAALLFHFYHRSGETISSIMNTVYPGEREETGGGFDVFPTLFAEWTDFFSPYSSILKFASQNVENSRIFDFFPIGIVLSVYSMVTKKKKNFLMILLLALDAVFLSFLLFKWPLWLAKVTLFSNVITNRATLAFGAINLFLLLISVHELRGRHFGFIIKLILILCGILMSGMTFSYFGAGKFMYLWLIVAAAAAVLCCIFFRISSEKGVNSFLIYVLVLSIGCGLTVNPIQIGISDLMNNDLVSEIETINDKKEGKWVVSGFSFAMNNIPTIVGASTLNSTAEYPNFEMWKILDPSGSHSDDYNRYLHLMIDITDTPEPEYELLQPDELNLTLDIQSLKKIGTTYILSGYDLSSLKESSMMKKLYSGEDCFIYEIIG